MSWIQTHTGRRVDFLNPDPNQINIEDIAHALSQICRFTGHSSEPYSVAQHCCYVSQLCAPVDALAGLMHDASEAYVGDINSPLKRLIPGFKEIETRVHEAIMMRFDLSPKIPESVKVADLEMLAIEARDLMGADPVTWGLAKPREDVKVISWPAKKAKGYFLIRFEDLYRPIEYGAALIRAGM